LVDKCGYDFMGLLDALTERQGLDLFAAMFWFVRVVNGRTEKSYEETLEEFGFADIIEADPDEAKPENDRPEA
ncbi:MAG TPA: hypothetical protein VFS26_06660, partial [Solirubrobacterales bacterium]|nr:hypothetical protein [Solirubrobacterales bacterium]